MHIKNIIFNLLLSKYDSCRFMILEILMALSKMDDSSLVQKKKAWSKVPINNPSVS